jgi:hypothetical protein
MGTVIRPETSKKNKYWIDRHRYHELKHFCLQYPLWKKAYSELQTECIKSSSLIKPSDNNCVSDPTAEQVERMSFYSDRMDMLERAAQETDAVLWRHILTAVTEGLSYDAVKARLEIPCCKDVYLEQML